MPGNCHKREFLQAEIPADPIACFEGETAVSEDTGEHIAVYRRYTLEALIEIREINAGNFGPLQLNIPISGSEFKALVQNGTLEVFAGDQFHNVRCALNSRRDGCPRRHRLRVDSARLSSQEKQRKQQGNKKRKKSFATLLSLSGP
jgi:hypothetical protein